MSLGTPVFRGSGAGTTTATTGSFTPGSGDLLFTLAGARKSASTPTLAATPIQDSVGGTWTTIDEYASFGVAPFERVRLAWRVATAVAMTVTHNSGNSDACSLSVFTVPGGLGGTFNFKTATNGAGDPSMTLSPSPAATSLLIAAAYGGGSGTWTSPAAFTEIEDATLGTNERHLIAYDPAAPASATAAFTSGNTNSVGFLVEITPAPEAITATDTGAFSGSEIRTIVASLARTDAGAFSATEAKSLRALLSRTDAGAFSGSEAKALLVLLSRVDSGVMTATEAAALTILTAKAASDSGAFSATEARALLATNPHSDTGALSVTETASVAVVVHRADSGVLSATEEATVVKTDEDESDGFPFRMNTELRMGIGL